VVRLGLELALLAGLQLQVTQTHSSRSSAIVQIAQFCYLRPMRENSTKSERLWLVISPEELEQLERWRGQQYPIPSRSEAVRHLLQRGLQAEKREKEVAK